ncbi:HNH endonuclease signature motif containing protein [Leifsonia sp. L25]|uniref:HNH endonuclease signature motif containing protein n=1 Tax=Actinomycetes TaxID=1760 RepID=UPI003D682435
MEPEEPPYTVMLGKYEVTIESYNPGKDTIERRTREDASGCLLWTGPLDKDGYGVASFEGRTHRAHRLSYETYVGPIPDGMQLDHVCETRACVRPEHLEPVTNFENTVRRFERQGIPRADAEAAAAAEMEGRQRMRAQDRSAKEQALERGIRKGTLVRDGRKKGVYKVWGFALSAADGTAALFVSDPDGSNKYNAIPLRRARVVDAESDGQDVQNAHG